jgi:hypothetical protein
MDAWANVSHFLSYKSEADIPTDLKRDFFAISGLFYMADKHFELFFQESIRSRERATESIGAAKPDLDQEINLDTLTAYVAENYADRDQPSLESISTVVQELRAYGYPSLRALDDDLRISAKAFAQYEEDNPPANNDDADGEDRRFNGVGVIRGSLCIAYPAFIPYMHPAPSDGATYARYQHLVEEPEAKRK